MANSSKRKLIFIKIKYISAPSNPDTSETQ